jgi:hypothetical protein
MGWTFYNASGQRLSYSMTSIANIDIDGGTDIGADIEDADLFIIDDNASGTNRKTTAARLKTYIGTIVIDDVTSTQTRNDSTTFVTTTITHDIAANEDWAWEIYVLYNSNSTADIKFEWQDIPTGLAGHWSAMGYQANGTVDVQSVVSLAGDLTAGGQGAVYATILKGVFIGGSGAGTLDLNFAQNTANASDTTIEIGSYGIFQRIR